jgi:homotetrameric cytidine deaminase
VLLLSDGTWVPGVRVESASFSLVIPALLNAVTTALAAGRSDIVAAVLSRPLRADERAYAAHLSFAGLAPADDDALLDGSVEALPQVGALLNPFLDVPIPEEPADGIALARSIADRAFVPASAYPVGCVLVTATGQLIPGVNVEHTDWSRTLCAERNALGTAMTWNQTALHTLYLTCKNDPTGSPCGACRQLLAELATDITLWMDRGETTPDKSSPARLLPGAFNGKKLARSA